MQETATTDAAAQADMYKAKEVEEASAFEVPETERTETPDQSLLQQTEQADSAVAAGESRRKPRGLTRTLPRQNRLRRLLLLPVPMSQHLWQ